MSVSTNQKLVIDFASQHPNSISGVPLKKRLFCSSQCSSPSSTELNMLPKDCGRPCKQELVVDQEAAASSVNRLRLALGTNEIMMDSRQVLGEQPYDGNLNLKSSSENNFNREGCQLNLQLDHPATRFHNDVDLKIDCTEHYVERVNLDLNIPIGSWDDTSDQVMQTNENCKLGKVNFLERKLRVSSIQAPLGTQVANMNLGTSGTKKAMRECSNVLWFNSSTSDDYKDSDVGLDLQLKLPSRPELRMDWAVNNPPHLTLSLIGDKSDWHSELDEDKIKNEMGSFQPDDLLSGHVNSEPFDGVPQNGTSKATCYTGQKTASSNVRLNVCEVRPQQCNDRILKGQQHVNNDRSEPVCTMGCQSTGKSLGLNCPTVNAQRRPPDCGLLLQSNPAIDAGESTVMTIGTCADSGSSKLDERAEVSKGGCSFKDVEGNVGRTSDGVESPTFTEKESAMERLKMTGLASSSFHDSGVSDAKEPLAPDGVSQGSAEMDCSTGEYYTSSKAVTESEITVDSCYNNLEGERKHIILDSGMTRDAFGNRDFAASISCAGDKDFIEDKVGSDMAKTSSNGPKDVHVKVPRKADAKEKQIPDSEQLTEQNDLNPGVKRSGKSLHLVTDLHGKTNKAMASSSHSSDRPSQAAKKNNFLNEKSHMNSKRVLSTGMKEVSVVKSTAKLGKNNKDNVLSTKEKLERHPDEKDDPNKHVGGREKDCQNKMISLTLRSSGAPLSSDRERSRERSHERDRSNSRGRRDESLTFEGYRRHAENVGRYGYGFRDVRRNRRDRDNYHQSSYMHSDRAYDTQYASEVCNSNYKRFPRSFEESPYPSRFTSRRRSPVPRDLLRPPGNQFPVNPMDASSGTYTEGDSDPREAKMRGLQNRVDRLVYPRSDMHYERSKRDKMHRERSNRVHPVSFRGHSDMPTVRRPPRQLCFPEDIIGRRPNSPSYCSDDMSEMCAAEEFDLPSREVRRNSRRLDFIEEQDDMDEYQESVRFIQPPELLADEAVDGRMFYESDGLPHPFDQQYDDEEVGLHYPVEIDQRRAIRFQLDADIRDDRVSISDSMRDFEGFPRNQLGSTNRLRYSGQAAGGYKYQNIIGFRDGGLDDVRMKRRRL